MKASRTEVLISIGGCDRPGGYNSPYVESWHPQTKEWTQMAKLPNFTKTEYAVCNIKNHIIVTGGRIHQKEVWIYQVRFLRTSFRTHFGTKMSVFMTQSCVLYKSAYKLQPRRKLF